MTLETIITNAIAVLNQAIGLLFVAATAVFLWGVIRYVIAEGDEKKLAESKKFMIYGLIGLFVMVAMWGIVYAVRNSLFGTSGGGPSLPRCIDVGGPPPPCIT